jgi:hypothetical protein
LPFLPPLVLRISFGFPSRCGFSTASGCRWNQSKREFAKQTQNIKSAKNDGFDVVIGNTPYGAGLMKTERDYLENKFNAGNTDTAALFMLYARKLSKTSGKNGFIIPKAFTYASNWQTVRDILLPDIEKIADCGKVWQNVKLEMSIYINQLNNTKDYFDYYKRNDTVIEKIGTKKKIYTTSLSLY